MIKRRHLSAGKSHQIKCEAFGAKPQATISWWLGGKQVSTILDILEIHFRIHFHIDQQFCLYGFNWREQCHYQYFNLLTKT